MSGFTKCSIEACHQGVRSLKSGLCNTHYVRMRRHGDANYFDESQRKATEMRGKTLLARLTLQFEQRGDCLIWTGAVRSDGYGSVYDPERKRARLTHVVMYEMHMGPTPDGMELDHLCRRRACGNPDHLQPVTHRTNLIRGHSGKGRTAWAAARTHCKNGHEWSSGRYSMAADGSRRCLECHKANQTAYMARKALA